MNVNLGFDAVWLEKLKQLCVQDEKPKTYRMRLNHDTFDELVSGIIDTITVNTSFDSPKYRLGDTVVLMRTYHNQRTAHRCVAMIRERVPNGYRINLKLGIIAVYEEG